jgi:hypothetical protein
MQSSLSTTDYVYITTPPWKDIYQDLYDAGCRDSQIAFLLGKQTSTIQYWFQTAKEPKYSEAVAILKLHARYCGEQKTNFRLNQEASIA